MSPHTAATRPKPSLTWHGAHNVLGRRERHKEWQTGMAGGSGGQSVPGAVCVVSLCCISFFLVTSLPCGMLASNL